MQTDSEHDNMKAYIDSFFEGMMNMFIFFPYFFSVGKMLKTLFSPWKKVVNREERKGFSFSQWGNDIMFDLISRGMGFMMRFSVIIFYLILQVLYVIFIPILLAYLLLSLPVAYLIFTFTKSEVEKKEELEEIFIREHLLQEENKDLVKKWFDYLYDLHMKPKHWWKLNELMKTPPIGRDWNFGYTPNLDNYSTDLTDPAYQAKIKNHIIGREKETGMIERVLSRSNEANVVLVGDKGVGRHTIINSLARKIYSGETNSILAYKRLLKLDMEKMISQFSDPVKREVFLEKLFKEASYSGSVVVLIDDFERYVSPGENHFDLTASVEEYGKTDKIQIIGITSPFNYEAFIYPNEKINSIFSKIDVEEVSKDQALYILMDKTYILEKRYKLIIPIETVLTTIDKSGFFITNVPFPEKAIQLLENVCIYTQQSLKKQVVMPDTVDTVITNHTHVPTKLTDQIKQKLLNLEQLLKKRILGQQEAIDEISSAMRRSFLLLGKRTKPLASFLFLGPTGVGKTETAKAINDVFFQEGVEPTRFDMSLYQTKEDIHKLLGSVQTLNPGLLTNLIRENPYGVLLLDEIEKAHPDLLNIFLTILDEGYFTDGYGQKVDCKNLIIIATSNAGAKHIQQMLIRQSMGRLKEDDYSSSNLIDYLVEQSLFSPEFLNRFDGVVAYKPIEEQTAQALAKEMAEKISENIMDMYKVHVNISEETLNKLTSSGYNKQYGVRNLDRVMRRQLEDQIAKKILSGEVKEGETINL